MDFELEELRAIDGDLELIARKAARYSFPTITVLDDHMYLNLYFVQLLGDVDYLSFGASSSYIVLKPANKASSTAFKLSRPKNFNGRIIIIPANLKEKKLAKGVYKIYKFGDGFAFKRYERLEDRQ